MAGVLTGCAGSGFSGNFDTAGNIIENSKDGSTELILHPVDIWDSEGGGETFTETVDGHELHFRHRPSSTFERAWVRVGLFWHSKSKKIFVPVAVVGPDVEIKQMQLVIDSKRNLLGKAKNFNFSPEKRPLDRRVSGSAFTMTPRTLRTMIAAKEPHIIIGTNRGNLRVDLSAVPSREQSALTDSAMYLFAEFAARQQEIAG